MWSEKDKLLFTIVNNFGEKNLEPQIEESSEKFGQLKKRPEFFVVFGYYNLNKDIFVWQNEMNKISYEFIKKGYIPLFKSDETIKKLFQPVVKFDKKNMNVIPYLMEALNAKLNVIRFKSPTAYIYALTMIDDIKETFKYENFNDAMFIYRYFDEIDKKYSSKNKKNKNKRDNSTRRNRQKGGI